MLSLGIEDILSLAYGAAGNMALMMITVTAVLLPTESELRLSLRECIKFLMPLLILAVPAELGGSEDGRSLLFPLVLLAQHWSYQTFFF